MAAWRKRRAEHRQAARVGGEQQVLPRASARRPPQPLACGRRRAASRSRASMRSFQPRGMRRLTGSRRRRSRPAARRAAATARRSPGCGGRSRHRPRRLVAAARARRRAAAAVIASWNSMPLEIGALGQLRMHRMVRPGAALNSSFGIALRPAEAPDHRIGEVARRDMVAARGDEEEAAPRHQRRRQPHQLAIAAQRLSWSLRPSRRPADRRSRRRSCPGLPSISSASNASLFSNETICRRRSARRRLWPRRALARCGRCRSPAPRLPRRSTPKPPL